MNAGSLAAEFPVAQKILQNVAITTGSVFALCHADGTVLQIDGPSEALDRAADVGFAAGTTLDITAPVHRELTERNDFGLQTSPTARDKAHPGWFYDYAPIHDFQTGRPLGAVVFAGNATTSVPVTRGLLRACATAIASHLTIERLLTTNLRVADSH